MNRICSVSIGEMNIWIRRENSFRARFYHKTPENCKRALNLIQRGADKLTLERSFLSGSANTIVVGIFPASEQAFNYNVLVRPDKL